MARHADAGPAEPELDAPRHATLWASVVYAVATLLLGYPALVGQFLINARSDQYIAGYAFRNFAAQSLKSGHGIPQWNPFLQGGMPYIAAMHGDIFYPTALMRWLMPTDVAMTWEFIIHLFLAGLFTYLFLRAWKLGFYSAVIGGLAYMLAGSIAGFASPGHDGKLFVATLTPAGLLLLTRGVRDGRAWAWGAFTLVVGLAFLSPHPQLFQYFLILAGSFTLFVAFADAPGFGKLDRATAIRRIGLALACVILGCLIGAIQYWPSMIEYTRWSPRAGGHSWEDATSYSFPIEEILNWYWPQFTGILDNYWGRNGIHLHSDYFGVVVLMLAGAAFGATGQKNFRRFWFGVFVVSLIWALGGYTPLYHIIMLVPGTKYLRAPSTMIFITSLATAVLAAIGTERVLARRVSARYALIWLGAAGVFAILMSVGGYSALWNATASSIAAERAPAQYASQIIDQIGQVAQRNNGDALAGAWRSFLFAALAAGVLWAWANARIAARQAAIALIVLVAVDLWSVERLYWIFSPPASQIFATDPAAEAIKSDIAKTGVPGRVFNAPLGQGIAAELGRSDRFFSGDKLMALGLRIPAGYHGNALGSYLRMLDVTIDSNPIQFAPTFWRHENVRYFYTGADQTLMDQFARQVGVPPFIKLAGPVRNSSGSMVYSYKVSTDNPPAWVTTAIVKAPSDQALGTVLDRRFDPRTVAIADTSMHDVTPAQLQALPAPATATATVSNYGPGTMDIKLSQPSTAGQALVVSENYFPGWQATAGGKPLSVALVNYNLMGIPLPAGVTSIELRFTDAAYVKGQRVTLLAVLIAIAALVAGLVVDRRRGESPVVAA